MHLRRIVDLILVIEDYKNGWILFQKSQQRNVALKNFEIIFHGTVHDYEDIISIAEEAKSKDVTIKFIHEPAIEAEDKEAAIQEIFKMIQDGPFEELKRQDVVRAFELASGSDFEVNVVAQ